MALHTIKVPKQQQKSSLMVQNIKQTKITFIKKPHFLYGVFPGERNISFHK